MKKLFITTYFALMLFIAPQILLASVVPAGTLDNSIWFSKDPFFVGESITVHTILYNSSKYNLEGTLTIRNGTTTIGSKYFMLDGGGASTIFSFPWTVTKGEHLFTATISNPFLTKNNTRVDDTISSTKTNELKRFADVDTDLDAVGNILDTDDDNDGLMDVEEKKLGTNSLLSDSDGDGIPDISDSEPLVVAQIVTKSTSSPSKLPDAVSEKISEHIPDPVLNKALPIFGTAETYREGSFLRMNEYVGNVVKEIIANQDASTTEAYTDVRPGGWEIFRSGTISGDIVHSPFAYIKLFFLLVWQFIVGNVYAFYLFILFCTYWVLRLIWTMIP